MSENMKLKGIICAWYERSDEFEDMKLKGIIYEWYESSDVSEVKLKELFMSDMIEAVCPRLWRQRNYLCMLGSRDASEDTKLKNLLVCERKWQCVSDRKA